MAGERFYSFEFFCTKDKYKKALKVLRKRNDVALSPFWVETKRDIFVGDRHVKTLEGFTFSGICFKSRADKVVERLAQRKIAGFNDESQITVADLRRIETFSSLHEIPIRPDAVEERTN